MQDNNKPELLISSAAPGSGVFTTKEFIFFEVIFLLGLALRWFELDARPVHHDESLHMMYGRYFFDFPDVNFYRYQAMLHGPLLYNVLRLVYNTLGSSTWAARALVAVLGTALMLSPLLFRRYFSKGVLLTLCASIALSPTLIYWSRFIREDNLQLSAMLLVLIGVVLVRPGAKALVVMAGITLQFCGKENSFVTTALLLGYLAFESAFGLACAKAGKELWSDAGKVLSRNVLVLVGIVVGLALSYTLRQSTPGVVLCLGAVSALAIFLWYQLLIERESDSMLVGVINYVRAHWLETTAALLLSALFYSYLYSAQFRYSKGILDGLYRESIGYWLNQHNIERIPGPFLFHFYMLSWYELLFVVLFLYQTWLFYRRADRWAWITGAALGCIAVFCFFRFSSQPVNGVFPWSFFKLKDKLDILGLFFLLFHPVLVTVQHLVRGEKALAFWGYLFGASFFTYSYLGEKVPWLSVYPFVPGLIYLALYFDAYYAGQSGENAASYPWWKLLRLGGAALCGWGLLFIFEEGLGGESGARSGALLELLGRVASSAWSSGPTTNVLLLMVGLLLIGCSFGESRLKILGIVNLRILGILFFCLYNVRAAVLTNFTYAGEASEFISQVHTTKEFHDFVLSVRRRVEAPIDGYKPNILGIEDAVWPITWYLVDIPEYKFSANESEYPSFNYIFRNCKGNCPDRNFVEDPIPGFRALKLRLRGWWVPDYRQMTFKKFLHYSINHRPWNDTGFSYVTVLVKANP